MNTSWFHTLNGKYNPKDRWVGLDFNRLLLDPVLAKIVLRHETVHGLLALQTEYGQFTFIMFKALSDLKDFDKKSGEQLQSSIYQSQLFVQEGLATFSEVCMLRSLTSRSRAKSWAFRELPDDYKKRFIKLYPIYAYSQKYRDYFMNKVSSLAMETGIRKLMPKLDLLKDSTTILGFLKEEDNNPDLRMLKILKTVKKNPLILSKSIPEIANECGVVWNEPTTKEEIVGFLNYVSSRTNHPTIFSLANVIDAPEGEEAFKQIKKDLIVGNMNIDFKASEVIFKPSDFLFYSDKFDYIFVNLELNWNNAKEIEEISGSKPEVLIAGVITRGDKYMTAPSRSEAEKFLNNELKNPTMIVKWGGYDILKDQLIWSQTARPPDLVLYNRPAQLLEKLKEVLAKKPNMKFLHLHAGAGPDHPLQTLILKVEGLTPIHLVDDFGNKEIIDILNLIKDQSKVMSDEEFRSVKKHLNNGFNFWLGLHEDVDWVDTMIDKETLIFRKRE